MTDITKLAQREKFEAWWEREYKHLESSKYTDAVPHIKYGFWMAYQAGGAELVEALEKAQAAATQQGNIACALLDEVTQLRRHADEKAPELRALLIEADSELEVLRQRIAELESRTVTAAASDVLAERQRQVTAEGWTAERDDGYQNSELADAAACYAIHAHNQGFPTPAYWPWSQDWWKQTSPRRDLVKAGALILAEIERLDRAAGIKVGEE